jgi:DNA-binding transcriptional ArsR family regulator
MNEVFRALADPTRREILRKLRRRPLTAGQIDEGLDVAVADQSVGALIDIFHGGPSPAE